MHINHQYPWINEIDNAGLTAAHQVTEITRIFWVVLAAVQNRLLPCCHRHADAVWNKSLTELTDVCSERSLSLFSFCFLYTRMFMWKRRIHINVCTVWCLMLSQLLLLTLVFSDTSCCWSQYKTYYLFADTVTVMLAVCRR